VLSDWEPYAALYYHATDRWIWCCFQAGEHIQSKPPAAGSRRRHDRGLVIRFWLQGYEDPDSRQGRPVRPLAQAPGHADTRTKLRVAALISRSAALRISANLCARRRVQEGMGRTA